VAKALAEGMLIEAYFTRSFYKMILGQELEFQDLEEQDYKIYESMKWYK
jgi:E3 ubiquitin-protein ligase HUWE1